MMKRCLWMLAVVAAIAMLSSCDNSVDECRDCCDPCPPHNDQELKDLTQKDDVLNNIELAYNKRRIEWYNGVLDQNFTFFLSTGDVNGGLPASWNRADEVDVNTKLLDKNYPDLPCQNVFMDIRAEDGVS